MVSFFLWLHHIIVKQGLYISQGVWVTADNRMYLAEAANCRIRRVTPADVAAQQLSCSTRLVDVLRPAGCAMYDPPVDQLDVMVR